MRKTVLLAILVFSVSFSQTELGAPSLSADAVLFYDTIFNQPINNKLHIKNIIDFNEKTIKRHIGYLNNRTPLNLIYNKTIGQYIKFYLFQREKQVAKLLALSEYYFPVFEAYLDKNKLPMELKYLPIVEIIPKHDLYDYDCKYRLGMSEYICPAEIDNVLAEKIQNDALKLHNKLGCRHYSRVDYRLNEKGEYYMLEINTLPGMTSTSLIPKAGKADNISFEQLLKKIIRLAI